MFKKKKTLIESENVAEEIKTTPEETSGDKCALRLVDIVKTYGNGTNVSTALKGVSINFRKNEFVSVLGQSGCGKTTMLNIIGGLDRYTSGDLIINGVSTKEYTDRDWDTYRNNSIGFVFQSYNLIPHQTVLSNVELALTLSGVSKAERRRRAKEVLKKVGLEHKLNKLPNQMSGGQMQRVAIARALVNDPEIILADEPTGALDTETSVQIMELLKEVAKDRLVIMVTHNPELAQKYSTRIITLLDGQKTGDTNPLEVVEDNKAEKGTKKAAMKISTAFGLSASNLRTKKGRTILTAIAGSIGIIGIALVLAVSTGFSAYITKLQADTLSVYPVTISENTIDLTDFEKLMNTTVPDEVARQRLTEKIYTKEMFGNLTNMLKSNNINQEYVKKDGTKIKYLDYVENYVNDENEKAKDTEEKWAYSLKKGYGFDVNNYIYSDIGFLGQKYTMPVDQLVKYLQNIFNSKMATTGISAEFVRTYIPTVSEIPENQTLVKSQYDLLTGGWAEKEDELLVVVDDYNRITDITLALLGIRSIDDIDLTTMTVKFGGNSEIPFSDIVGKEFYYVNNDNRYKVSAGGENYDKTFIPNTPFALTSPDLTMKVKGIVRKKEGISQGVLDTGIAYTSAFKNKVLSDNRYNETKTDSIVFKAHNDPSKSVNNNSWYIKVSKDDVAKTINFVDGDPYMQMLFNMAKMQGATYDQLSAIASMNISYKSTERELAGDTNVNKLSIYSSGYDAKERLKTYLDKWNTDVVEPDIAGSEEAKVHYSDSTAMLFSALNSVVDAVEIVLICFTGISLVVSSIMIGIITYVSVVERTKEIGVLRAIGARKKDISRIFNAETFLIGLIAGLIGVVMTYLLSIPINLIVGTLIKNAGAIASLKITHALILVAVSFALTLIAGIIPSRIAAKKDPVVALRSE